MRFTFCYKVEVGKTRVKKQFAFWPIWIESNSREQTDTWVWLGFYYIYQVLNHRGEWRLLHRAFTPDKWV